jgi:hypothetical protein
MATSFTISLSFKGKIIQLHDIRQSTSGSELYNKTRQQFGWAENDEVKLLYKGKKLQPSDDTVFSNIPKKIPKIIVMATSSVTVSEVANQKTDPLMRGFEHEKKSEQKKVVDIWGMNGQNKKYKFCRFEPCSWQSFGHKSTESTPHSFAAQRLLEKLATDPGVIAVMKERELVVNTLGEMDPIDDRLMQKHEKDGSCLLGYNTNHGLRIDIKLRTDDLHGFRPYPSLVATLIHELSHNWVGDHNLLFWTNFAQMRAEYYYCHMHSTHFFNGKGTAEIAGLSDITKDNIFPFIIQELERDMQQHGLHPNMIQHPIQKRCQELDQSYATATAKKQRLGGGENQNVEGTGRERALAAAERRRQQQQQKE